MKQLICVLLLTIACLAEVSAEFCNINDKNFNECARKNLQEQIKTLSKEGNKEIGIPKLDPFYIPKFVVDYENGKTLSAKSVCKNGYTHGMKNTKILGFRSDLSDPKNMKMEIDFMIPDVFVEGSYKTEGKLDKLMVKGRGVYNITMTNVGGTSKVKAHLEKQNGEDYLKIDNVICMPTVDTMKIYASNLVDGSPELSNLALIFANENWRELYKMMLPYAAKGFDKLLTETVNKVTLKIPFNKLVTTK